MARAFLIALAALAVAPAPTDASFPGDNGRLAIEAFAPADVGSGAETWLVTDATRITPAGTDAAEPAWSADGARIAFTTAAADEVGERFETRADLWTAAADGTRRRRITRDKVADFEPAFSPDGRTLAFSSYRAPRVDAEIWTVSLRTKRLRRLTRNRAYDSDPEYSPNGRRIAYGSGRDVWVMDRDGSHARRLAAGSRPSWSPDGTQIAFDAGGQVFVMEAGGSGVQQVTHEADGASAPAWSPDGALIAYATAGAIATVAPDGSGRAIVVAASGSTRSTNPAWQPLSGARVAPRRR